MIRRLLISLLVFAPAALAQNAPYHDIALSGSGRPIAGASIFVCAAGASGNPCSPTVTIYKDSTNSNPITQPLLTDSYGNFSFYAPPGNYEYTVSGNVGTTSAVPFTVSCQPGITCVSANSNNAFTGNNTHSGSETFTGNVTATAGQNQLAAFLLNGMVLVDGVKYANTGAGIQAAINSLPTVNSKPAGTVVISNPITMSNGQEVTIGPWTKLVFSPTNSVTYSGTGTAFTCSDAPTTYGGDGGIYGLDLTVSNNAGSGIAINECTWFKLAQVWIQGSGASSTGIPILFSNTQKWTEQANLDLVHVQNFVKPITYQDNCPGNTGCSSFAYHRYRHVVVTTLTASGKGFELQNDSTLGGGDLELQCFLVQSSTCLHLANTSSMVLPRLKIGGEFVTGATAATGILTDVGTTFQLLYQERWNVSSGITDTFNGTYIPYIYNNPGLGFLQGSANGLIVGPGGSSFSGTFDVHNVTNFRTWTFPDANMNVVGDTTAQTLTNKTLTNPTINGTNITGTPASANLTATIASGTAAMTTSLIGAGACGATVTVGASGVLTTDAISWSFNAAPSANPAELVVSVWPTANNVNFQYCNPSAGGITPSAATLNWRVVR